MKRPPKVLLATLAFALIALSTGDEGHFYLFADQVRTFSLTIGGESFSVNTTLALDVRGVDIANVLCSEAALADPAECSKLHADVDSVLMREREAVARDNHIRATKQRKQGGDLAIVAAVYNDVLLFHRSAPFVWELAADSLLSADNAELFDSTRAEAYALNLETIKSLWDSGEVSRCKRGLSQAF